MDAAAADARSWGLLWGRGWEAAGCSGCWGIDSLAQCLELELCPDLPTTQVGELSHLLKRKENDRKEVKKEEKDFYGKETGCSCNLHVLLQHSSCYQAWPEPYSA